MKKLTAIAYLLIIMLIAGCATTSMPVDSIVDPMVTVTDEIVGADTEQTNEEVADVGDLSNSTPKI